MKFRTLLFSTALLAICLRAQQPEPIAPTDQTFREAKTETQPSRAENSARFMALITSQKHVQERLDKLALDGYELVFAAAADNGLVLAAVKSEAPHQYRWFKKAGDEYKSALADGFAIVPATFDTTGFVMEKTSGATIVHDYLFLARPGGVNWPQSMQESLDEALASGYVPIALARSGPMVLMEKGDSSRVEPGRFKVVGVSPLTTLWKFPKGVANDLQTKLNEAATEGYGVFGISGGPGFLAILRKETQRKSYLVVSSEANSLKPFNLFRRLDEKGFQAAAASHYRVIPGGTVWLLEQSYYPVRDKIYLNFYVMEQMADDQPNEYTSTLECGKGSADGVVLATKDRLEVVGMIPSLCRPILLLRSTDASPGVTK